MAVPRAPTNSVCARCRSAPTRGAASSTFSSSRLPPRARESTKRGKDTEVSEILGSLGEWHGKDDATGFDLVKRADGRILKVADLVDDGPDRHAKVLAALKDSTQKNNRDHVDNPFIAANREVIHKIGVTGGDVKARIANARKDATYLLADVEIVATYKLANINRTKLEQLLHKFFASARLDLELKDRFGFDVTPREWFLVPISAINDSVQRLMDGTIADYCYESRSARLVKTS